jgi:iron complex transport system substrate-binding protein
MTGFRRLAAAALLMAAAVVSSGAHPGQQADARTKAPARIVSLVPAVTEMLFALGAGPRVVGVSSFDHFPPEVERLPRVGALLDPDIERILSLRPDLVVVYRSQTDVLAQLGRAQVPLFVYSHAGLADVTVTLRRLGERIGLGTEAERLATEIERRIEAIRATSAKATRPRTLVVFGRDAFALRGIYASGGIGFVHDMVTAAGGDNVFIDAKREAVQATTELIIARAPEVIIELRAEPMDREAREKEVRTWSSLVSVPAVRSGKVRILDDPRTVVPGPRVAEGIELIAAELRR